MSRLRELLAASWAALWLRGRLLGLRLRKLFGRASATDPGAVHRFASDIPVEGVDYDPDEVPAELAARLEATRAELVDRARTAATRPGPSRGRRRRTASLVLASLLGLGVVGAGASALVAGSTGVPAVDRLLGIYEQGLDEPGASGRSGPSGSDLQPGPSEASEPIVVSLADGSRAVTSFYVAQDGKLCAATAAADGETLPGPLACEAYPAIAANVTRNEGYVPAIGTLGTQVVVKGYVSARVVGLGGSGPYGALDVSLGKAWTPGVAGAEPLKPFVAVGPLGSDGTPDGVELQRSIELGNYAFDATTDDGDRVRITP